MAERQKMKPMVNLNKEEPVNMFLKQFFKTDYKTWKKWFFKQVFIPGLQNAIINSLSKLFFEDEISPRVSEKEKERSSLIRANRATLYHKMHNSSSFSPSEDDDIPDYRDELGPLSIEDADAILLSCKNYISDFGKISVLQLYEKCSITHPDFQLDNWGWDKEAFKGATKKRGIGGWYLVIPEAISIKNNS